eukprot:362507-Chlamydomonas_euryale.AAC.9
MEMAFGLCPLTFLVQQLADAKEAARRAAEEKQQETLRKRQTLNKGFSSVAGPTAAQPATAGASGTAVAAAPAQPAIAPGDEAEVKRVMGSSNDYVVLKLHVGASLSQVRKSYRTLAIALHPDKCKTEGAADAFQRVQQAYSKLVKELGG